MPEPKRILVVDDEKLVADTLVLIMRGHGFHATACYGGEEALSAAPAYKPDLLLTDFEMPRVSGVEVALNILGRDPLCRVLILSAHPGPLPTPQPVPTGMREIVWIEKPVHPGTLLLKVDSALGMTGG